MTTKLAERPIRELGFKDDIRRLSPLLTIGPKSCDEDAAFALTYTAGDLVTAINSLRKLIPKHGARPIATLVRWFARRLGLEPAMVKLAGKVVELAKPKKAKAKGKRGRKPRKIEQSVASVGGVETRASSF